MGRHLIRFGLCTAAVFLLQIAGLGAWQAVAAAIAVVLIANVVATYWVEG